VTLQCVCDGSGRLICVWLGVVWAWSTHSTVSNGRDWLGVVVAPKADLNWKLTIAGLWTYGDSRHVATGCTVLVLFTHASIY